MMTTMTSHFMLAPYYNFIPSHAVQSRTSNRIAIKFGMTLSNYLADFVQPVYCGISCCVA